MTYKDGKAEPQVGDTVLGAGVKGVVVGLTDAGCKGCDKARALHAGPERAAAGGACKKFSYKDGVKVLVRARAPWDPKKPLAEVQAAHDPSSLELLRRK